MKKKLYLFLVLLCMGAARPCFSQSILNTATTIILNNTCFLSSSGSYTLTINYVDLGTNTLTPTTSYACTVTVSGAEVIISVPTGTFPTVASTGYWNLSDTKGMIELTGGTTNGLVNWNLNQFNCIALPVEIVNFAATLSGTHVNLTWQTELEQNTTYFNIYRSSTAASGSYYKIGQVTAAGNSSGTLSYSFTDNSPDATNYYYLQMANSDGTCTTTPIASANCSTCHFTPPSPVACSNAISGATSICALEDHETYQLTSAIPNYSTINWSVSPASLVHVFANGCNPSSISMIKTASSGVATLTATVSGCNTTFTKQILIGVPGSLNPSVNATSGVATCESLPGTTNSSYVWTLNLGSKGTTTYVGQTVYFYLPACSGGGMDVAVTAACGVSHDGETIWNSNCSGAVATVFSVSPNPASGTVTITPKSSAVSMTDATGATTQVVNPTVSRLEVYNKMGSLLIVQKFPEGSKQVSLNVYNLPSDNYVLHIFYNNNQQTEVQQLSVRR